VNPAIEALRTDLVSLMAEVLMAHDEQEAVAILRKVQAKIEAALTVLEASHAG
jgi:hypothetical protein